MNSSRMHTVHSNGHLSCHVCTPAMHALPCTPPVMHATCHAHPLPCMPPDHACPPPCTPPATHGLLPCMTLPCKPPALSMPPTTMHAPCHACSPVDRRNNTRLRKHYLSTTTVADGKKNLPSSLTSSVPLLSSSQSRNSSSHSTEKYQHNYLGIHMLQIYLSSATTF